MENDTNVFEYASFYGSIQILRYLSQITDKKEITTKLLKYAIHSNNAEAIHVIEEKLDENRIDYFECFKESLKCHHFDLADYFKNQLDEMPYDVLLLDSFKYHNYSYFPDIESFSKEIEFFDLCQYNYPKIVEILMNTQDINVEY